VQILYINTFEGAELHSQGRNLLYVLHAVSTSAVLSSSFAIRLEIVERVRVSQKKPMLPFTGNNLLFADDSWPFSLQLDTKCSHFS
jgi:hypothetical protein